MKVKKNVYKAINVLTGEELVGTAREMSEYIGLSPSNVAEYAKRGSLYKRTYKFILIEKREPYQKDSEQCNSLTIEDLDEWDKFVNSLKKYRMKEEREKKWRFRKPQEVKR